MRSMRKREVVCGSAIEQKFRFRWEEKKQKRVGVLKLAQSALLAHGKSRAGKRSGT
jgi:hypothetical protein